MEETRSETAVEAAAFRRTIAGIAGLAKSANASRATLERWRNTVLDLENIAEALGYAEFDLGIDEALREIDDALELQRKLGDGVDDRPL